jgi:pimeloyl-ACP methyl ester carboxylesterase
VTPRLRKAGHDVVTPTLTGLGERSHLAHPDIDLDTHVEDIVAVLSYEDLRDVVLVGHSYGGMVITGVAARGAEWLAHLVYLDAFVPDAGQSLLDFVGELAIPVRQQAEAAGGFVPSFPAEAFGVTAEADMAWVQPKLTPQPFKTFTQPVGDLEAAGALPRTYIYCGNPAMGPFDQFAEKTKTASGWRYRELETGHDAMVTMPQELTEILLELA